MGELHISGTTRWRTKPVEVEMIRWDGSDEILRLISLHGGPCELLPDESVNLEVVADGEGIEENLDLGGWVILAPDGSIASVCTAAEHEATYEPITEG